MSTNDLALSRQLSRLENLTVQLNTRIDLVSGQVASVGQRADETHNELARLIADFQRFVLEARKADNLQNALTNKGTIESRLEYQFGHHKVVRRSAVGVLQGFDVGLLSEETVRSVSEQLMIQNPRYWLAPALVALGAWAGDEPDLCDRAIQEAFRRSPGRTSLFMALVLRRQGRRESSVRWLRQYLAAQDPTKLGRHFAVVLECVAQGAFGPAGLTMVQERLEAWQAQLLDDEAMRQAQVDRWRAEVERHVAAPTPERFPRLAALSPQFPAMAEALARAGAHQNLITKYSALAAEEPTVAGQLEDAVDDILDQLVNEYDDEELPLRREHALNEAIIRHHGDLAAAQQDVPADLAALESTLDYLTIQSESALNPAGIGVSRSTQRMAVAFCHDWFATAHGEFSMSYRQGLPANVEAVFQSTHNHGARAFQLPRWVGSFTRPLPELEQSLAQHWDRTSQPYLASLGFDWMKQSIIPGIVSAVVLVVFTLCLQAVGILLGLATAAAWFLVLYLRSQTAATRQQEAARFIAKAKHDSILQLRAASAEVTDWSTAFRAADSKEPAVRALIEDLSRSGAAASPFERRVAGEADATGGA